MFIIIEIQKFSEDSVAIPTPIYANANENQAESEFHRLCSLAAISSVPQHSILMIYDDGRYRNSVSFLHPVISSEE